MDVTQMLIESAEQIFSIENAYEGIEWVSKKEERANREAEIQRRKRQRDRERKT